MFGRNSSTLIRGPEFRQRLYARRLPPSPETLTKPTKLPLPRCRETRRRVFPCDPALALQLWFPLFWTGRLYQLGIGWLHLREGLTPRRLDRNVAGRFRGRDARLTAGDLSRNDRRNVGIENNALWPFPIGMNTDDGRIGIFPFKCRYLREICIQNQQQREQYAANEGKISREWHVLLHCGAAPASTGTRARLCLGTLSAVLQRFNVERSATPKFLRRPSASTDAVHRTTAIHWSPRGANAGGRHCASNWPRTQHDTRSNGATSGIVDILAVDDGVSRFDTCGYKASNQQHR